MPPVSPRSFPAVRWPQPGRASSDGTRRSVSAWISRPKALTAVVSSRIRASRSRLIRADGSERPPRSSSRRARTVGWPSVRGCGSGIPSSTRNQRRRDCRRVRIADETDPVVDEQADLPLGAVEAGDWQIPFPERRPSHRLGVDRIALARLARRATGSGRELGRDAQNPLSAAQQVTLEPTGQTAAILDGEGPLPPAARPAHELEMAVGRGRDRLLSELATIPINGNRGVSPLVRIDPDDDHVGSLLLDPRG